jgi:hypothetical protein
LCCGPVKLNELWTELERGIDRWDLEVSPSELSVNCFDPLDFAWSSNFFPPRGGRLKLLNHQMPTRGSRRTRRRARVTRDCTTALRPLPARRRRARPALPPANSPSPYLRLRVRKNVGDLPRAIRQKSGVCSFSSISDVNIARGSSETGDSGSGGISTPPSRSKPAPAGFQPAMR